MTFVRSRLGVMAAGLLALFTAVLVVTPAPADTLTPVPKGFPRASFVSGDAVTGERSAKGVLLHAQWFDDQGEPQKYFRQAKRFPWPTPMKIDESAFRVRLTGVRYPGKLELGVFRGTGPAESPAGGHDLYSCTFPSPPDAPCRWVPSASGAGEGWDVMVDHAQAKGHLYIVAVGSWEDPRDPPKPIGTRSQIATWLFHAKVAGS